MKVNVCGLDGEKIKQIELPEQFNEDYEPSLIKRAILVIFSHRRQKYGAMARAGKNYSAKLSRRRRDYKTGYGKGASRVPRKTMWRRGTQFSWVGALAPGTVGGRRAHPPKSEKKFELKINNKERKKAIRSALSAVVLEKKLVVVDNKLESLKKTKEIQNIFTKLGLQVDNISRQRSGKGRSRGRKINYKKNALIVVAGRCDLIKGVSNLPGFDVTDAKSINTSLLTLGHEGVRPCLFTEGAIEKIHKEKLFK